MLELSMPRVKKNILGSNIYTLSRKQNSSLGYFWNGFAIYTFFFAWSMTDDTLISPAMCQGFQLIGFMLFLAGAFPLLKFKFDSNYLQSIFTIYIIYSSIVVLRGFKYDVNSIKNAIFHVGMGALPYFTPLVVLLPRNFQVYKKMFSTLVIFGIGYYFYVVLFYDILHDPDRLNLQAQYLSDGLFGLLAYPVSFILLTFFYHTGKKALFGLGKINIMAIGVILVGLFFSIYRARRGSIFMCASTIMVIIMLYFIYSKNKAMIIFMGIVTAATLTLFFASRNTPALFNFLLDRADQDTRTGVEEYMMQDMSPIDWVIGKGFNGRYFCPTVEDVKDMEGIGSRDVVETGYLQIILTGGVMSFGLLLLILLPAVYLGIFKSRNILAKASGVFILLFILYEYPGVVIGFTMHYFLVWIGVGICYSKKIRGMSDMLIKTYMQRST